MRKVPSTLQAQFVVCLRNKAVPNETHASHMKWLRYYFDFCEKYHFPHAQTDSLSHFLDKLHQKKQTHPQQQQARHAIMLYHDWVRHYQTFTRSQDPKSLSTQDVKEFLTHLAVDQKVSASTQNQAFNALLFFHRHVLNKEFGKVEGVVRAKRKPYIPVVLSREEIEAVLKYLGPPFDLVVKLLGCGLRLFEGCICAFSASILMRKS